MFRRRSRTRSTSPEKSSNEEAYSGKDDEDAGVPEALDFDLDTLCLRFWSAFVFAFCCFLRCSLALVVTCMAVVTEQSLFLFFFVASENLAWRIETDLDVGTRMVTFFLVFVFDRTGSNSVQRRRCKVIIVARIPLAILPPEDISYSH